MIPLQPLFKKAYWGLAGAGGLYAIFMLCLTNLTIQRNALYANQIVSAWWADVDKPQAYGFAKNQVTAFNLTTHDGEVLYAWHVLPLNVYEKHQAELSLADSGSPGGDFTQTKAFQLLQSDPKARLVINFHGNAGNVAQGWRTDTYRALTSQPHTHLLTLDYRGFGRSTGAPTEAGLIADGTALAHFALSTLHLPPHRILLLGQSLGTAVASSVALHFADPSASSALSPASPNTDTDLVLPPAPTTPTDFAALILVAPFTSLPVLVESYRIFGLVPLLSPLRGYPRLSNWLRARIVDTWDTLARIEALTAAAASSSSGRRLRLHVVHAKDDFDIRWEHGEAVFQAGRRAVVEAGKEVEEVEEAVAADGGRVGSVRSVRGVGGADVEVRMDLLAWGGHNRVVTFAPVGLAVLRAFEAAGAGVE